MDEEYRAQLTEQLHMVRRLQNADKLARATYGISADPSLIIRIEDREQEIADLEARLGIRHPAPARAVERERYTPPPTPQWQHAEQIAQRQERARQGDIDHQMPLLKTYRSNLAHYRTQARSFGGIELAPPITRHGMNEARDGIIRTKHALEAQGVVIDNLPGDE